MSAEDPGDINVDDLNIGDSGGDSGSDGDVGGIFGDPAGTSGGGGGGGIDAGGFGEELGGDPAGDADRATGGGGGDESPPPGTGGIFGDPSGGGGGDAPPSDPTPDPDPAPGPTEGIGDRDPVDSQPAPADDPQDIINLTSTDPRFRGDIFQDPAQQISFTEQFEQRQRQRFDDPSIVFGPGDFSFTEAADGDFLGQLRGAAADRELPSDPFGPIPRLDPGPGGIGIPAGQTVLRPDPLPTLGPGPGGTGIPFGDPETPSQSGPIPTLGLGFGGTGIPLGSIVSPPPLPAAPGLEPTRPGDRPTTVDQSALAATERATRPGEPPPPDLLDGIDPAVVEGLTGGEPFRVRLQKDPIGALRQVIDDPVDFLEGGAFTEAEEQTLREGGSVLGVSLPGARDFDRFQDRFEENEPVTIPELGTAEADLIQDIAPLSVQPFVTPALARFGGSDAPESLIQGQARAGVDLLNVPRHLLTAESALEATAGLDETLEEEGPVPVAETAAAGAALAATETIRGAREDPIGAVGRAGASAAIGFGAGSAIERAGGVTRTFSVARQAARRGDPDVDFRDITSERGARGELPEFETSPDAPTAGAVAEVRERAADQPPDVLDELGDEGALFHSTRQELPEELTVERGRSELPGLFTSPDASPLRLDEGLQGTLASLRPRLPRPGDSEDRLPVFPADRIEGMPPGATGSGRIFDPETGDFVPDPSTSGARFLEDVAEAETAFVRPQGGRTTELEAIFPPGSQFRQQGTVRVDLPSGRSIPGPIFRPAPDLDAGDLDDVPEGITSASDIARSSVSRRQPGEPRPFAPPPPGGTPRPADPDMGDPSTPDVTDRPGATDTIPPPEPTPVDPTPTDPTMTEPVSPAEPTFTDPSDTVGPTDPGPTGTITGGPTRPTATGPTPSEPTPVDPTPTDPTPTDPAPTNPPPPSDPPPTSPPPSGPPSPPRSPPGSPPGPPTSPPTSPPGTPTGPPATPPPSVFESERDDDRRRFGFGLGQGFTRTFERDVLTPEEALEGLDPDPAEVDPDPAARELASSVDPAPTVTDVFGKLPSETERALQRLTDPND